MKWVAEDANRNILVTIAAVLGGIQSYRRLIEDPQKVRRWNRNGSIAALAVICWFMIGEVASKRAASPRQSPIDTVHLRPHQPDPKVLLFAAAQPIVGVLMTELLIGKREIISPRRATVLAFGLSAFRVVSQDVKRRIKAKNRVRRAASFSVRKGSAVPNSDMAISSFSYDDALEWISTHSMNNSLTFSKSANRLGDEVIPAMLQVVAQAPLRYVTPAVIVLGCHGVRLVGSGKSASEYRYQVAMPDGTETILVPTNRSDADIDESDEDGPEHVHSVEIVTEGSITKSRLGSPWWSLRRGKRQERPS